MISSPDRCSFLFQQCLLHRLSHFVSFLGYDVMGISCPGVMSTSCQEAWRRNRASSISLRVEIRLVILPLVHWGVWWEGGGAKVLEEGSYWYVAESEADGVLKAARGSVMAGSEG